MPPFPPVNGPVGPVPYVLIPQNPPQPSFPPNPLDVLELLGLLTLLEPLDELELVAPETSVTFPPHAGPVATPTSVRPSTAAPAVRWIEPSAPRSGVPHFGQRTSRANA
jgi:hypothetical protein